MTGRDLLKSTNPLQTTFTKTYSTDSSSSQSAKGKSDDFSKVLFAKRDEKRVSEKSTANSEDKKDISKKETSKSDKPKESHETENKDKKTESKDQKAENKDKKIDKKDQNIENIDENVENIDLNIENIDLNVGNIDQSVENIDQNTEQDLSELSTLIEDLIHTLQSSNIIDKDKLQQIVSGFEKANLNSDEMESLIKDLELIGKDIANLDTQDINDKLIKISKLVGEIDTTVINENAKQLAEGSKLMDAEKNRSAEPLQNQKNFSTGEEKIVGEKVTEKKEKAEVNVSLQNNSKDKQPFITKKNMNNTTSKENDFDFLNIKNIQIDDYKSSEITGVNKSLENIVKPDMKIFNQIIEGTKINISEDVSEMVIKMKPDNLGKLSMKIVVERGMLVARFEVESQIVKEAVESNLEDLRNALKDKGFEVQQLDVSVNKDSDHSENKFSHFNKGKSKKMSIMNEVVTMDIYNTSHQTIDGLTSTINYLG